MKKKRLEVFSKIVLFVLIIVASVIIWKNGSIWLDKIQNYSWVLDYKLLSISAILLIVSLSLTPLGWVLICQPLNTQIPLKDMFAAWYNSQLGRYIPGKIWLFAGRAGFLKARGVPLSTAAATTAFELFFNIASIGLITLIVFLFIPDILTFQGAKAVVLTASITLLLLPLLRPIQKFICKKKGIESNQFPNFKTSVITTTLFAALWVLRGLALFLLLKGVGLTNIFFFRSLAAAPLSWLAGYIVFFVPGGIGVREAAAAAIAAPTLITQATIVIAGQRIFMAIIELLLALVTAKNIKLESLKKKEK